MKITLDRADAAWLEEAWHRLTVKLKAQTERIGSMIPYTPRDGKYHDLDYPGGLSFWTNGFWPGILWQMYNGTGDDLYRDTARAVGDRLSELLRGPDEMGHDIGFLFLPSAVADWRKTGSAEGLSRGLHAAQMLAGRFNPAGNFIRAWPDSEMLEKMMGGKTPLSGWMIIDCMMNLPLLYWASEQTGDPRYAHIARLHAQTAQKYVVRVDGSCNHIVCIDPVTGEFIEAPGGQGYGPGSAWSRGQSWAVYGFALSYRHTGDESFLNTAKRCAHYCIANLAVSDWLPPVDYRAPAQPAGHDSTAGMITACGLLEIAQHISELERPLYIGAAVKILRACEQRFCNWDPEQDSVVGGGTFFYHDPDGSNTDVPIIYGDYYFIEAVLRLMDRELFIW